MIVLVNKKKFIRFTAIVFIMLITLVGILNFNNIKKSMYPQKYSLFVEKYSEEYKIDKFLVYSIIKAESNFNETAFSSKGAIGLMQLMPETAVEMATVLGIENPDNIDFFDPDVNIKTGCYYISCLLERYNGDITTVAAAYNAGIGNVDTWLAKEQANLIEPDIVPFGETKKYIEKVSRYYEKYIELYTEGK